MSKHDAKTREILMTTETFISISSHITIRTSGCNSATGRLNSAKSGTLQNCSIKASSFPYSVSVIGDWGSSIVGTDNLPAIPLLDFQVPASIIFLPLPVLPHLLVFFFLAEFGIVFLFFRLRWRVRCFMAALYGLHGSTCKCSEQTRIDSWSRAPLW